ncbi:MAG TPA: TldD/PmbA family protein [Chloroflexi bacterium]|jgi:PmbA protein|nr:TldD/PmbA family protein [Chloroflexota bacterium]
MEGNAMDILSALRKRTEQAEVYTVESESTMVSFEANEVKSAKVEETRGIALRGMVDGRMGFTAAGGRVTQEELIENLLDSARYGDRIPIVFPAPAPGPEVETYDPGLIDVPIARFVEIGREIIAALRKVDPDAQVNVDIRRSVDRSALRNSAGTETAERSSSLIMAVSIERVRGDDVLIVYDAISGISLTDEYRDMVSHLTDKLELAKRAATLQSGRMPVLFSPKGASVLMLPIMQAVSGESVQRGTSPLSNRLGEQLFDRRLTVWDDPTLPGRPGSASYDDEGVPCRRKALIENGVARGFLFDLKTAALMETESTGNGSRGLFSTPSPSATNLIIEPGDTPLSDILKGIDRGLLVDDVLGLGQGNTISGAFSNTVGLAYVIEGGEIVGRVKDVSIAGNIYQDLREIAAISRESRWLYGHIQMPYILLSEINVVGKG